MNYKELTVEKLIIKDPNSKGHIELCGRGFGDGPTIRLCDDDNWARADLGMDSHGAMRLTLLDAHHQERIKLSVLGGGGAALSLSDANGRERVSLITEPGSGTFLCLSDANGATRISLEVDGDDNDPSLEVVDRNGKARVRIAEDHEGRYHVLTYDAAEEETWRAPAEEAEKGDDHGNY